jgi:hypothetical protein
MLELHGAIEVIHPNPSVDRVFKNEKYLFLEKRKFNTRTPDPHDIQSNEPPP